MGHGPFQRLEAESSLPSRLAAVYVSPIAEEIEEIEAAPAGFRGSAQLWKALAKANAEVPLRAVETWRDRLIRLTPDEALDVAPDVLTGREDVAAAALLLLAAVLVRFDADAYLPTTGGLRHGLALAALDAEAA